SVAVTLRVPGDLDAFSSGRRQHSAHRPKLSNQARVVRDVEAALEHGEPDRLEPGELGRLAAAGGPGHDLQVDPSIAGPLCEGTPLLLVPEYLGERAGLELVFPAHLVLEPRGHLRGLAVGFPGANLERVGDAFRPAVDVDLAHPGPVHDLAGGPT